jgi:hypothetical protein
MPLYRLISPTLPAVEERIEIELFLDFPDRIHEVVLGIK